MESVDDLSVLSSDAVYVPGRVCGAVQWQTAAGVTSSSPLCAADKRRRPTASRHVDALGQVTRVTTDRLDLYNAYLKFHFIFRNQHYCAGLRCLKGTEKSPRVIGR